MCNICIHNWSITSHMIMQYRCLKFRLIYVWYILQTVVRADFRSAPSQWETALLRNDFSHWLGADPESALSCVYGCLEVDVSHSISLLHWKLRVVMMPTLSPLVHIGGVYICYNYRDHSWYELIQCEEALHCNASSHWLSPYQEWSLI